VVQGWLFQPGSADVQLLLVSVPLYSPFAAHLSRSSGAWF
jgi:hypothetical protein